MNKKKITRSTTKKVPYAKCVTQVMIVLLIKFNYLYALEFNRVVIDLNEYLDKPADLEDFGDGNLDLGEDEDGFFLLFLLLV